MGVYGSVNKIINSLENMLLKNKIKSGIHTVESLKKIWPEIEKYSENIYPDETKYFKKILTTMTNDNIAITDQMINTVSSDFTRMKKIWNEEKKVKTFYLLLFWLIEKLLIFNRDREEACDICQGSLFYFFDEQKQLLIKECSTCGIIYDAKNEQIIRDETNWVVRPAKKSELKLILKEYEGFL